MRKLMCFVALAALASGAYAAGSNTTTPGANSSASSTTQPAPGGSMSTDVNTSTPAGAVKSSTSATTSGLQTSTTAGGFARIDADGDGNITKKEATKDTALAKKFGSLDLNHDGKLDSMEFSAFEATGSATTDTTKKPQ